MSAKSGTGMKVWLDKVPMRQQDMKDWEILLSESQERMLVIIKKGREKDVEKIFDKWDLTWAIIGEVTDSGRVQYYMQDELVADIPSESLVLGGGAPVYHREYKEPKYFEEIRKFNLSSIKDCSWQDAKNIALKMAAHPNICSRKWVYEQYDSMVGTVNQTTNAPSDASVVKVRESDKSIAMSVDCNSRYVYANPEVGAAIAVCEAARNIVCAGGVPAGVTNCLNFGNPYNPEVYYQFVYAIKGMGNACRKLGTPVTGGNVSFYNQSSDENAVFPTPTIGMVGLIEDNRPHMTLDFKNEGDLVYLIGTNKNDIASSQYLVSIHGVQQSPAPYFDLDEEYKVQQAVLTLIKKDLILSAHDCSEGGLFITLLESCMPRGLGVSVNLDMNGLRTDAVLFGEAQSRVVVSLKASVKEAFEKLLQSSGVAYSNLGEVKGTNMLVNGTDLGSLQEYTDLYKNSLGKLLGA
jgi:phosphoribosylformylglycinamidine synthase subunit PurL